MADRAVRWCGLCGHWDLVPLLDMGMQPLPERDDGTRYPLRLMECRQCGLAQLDYMVDQRILFRPDHPYATGNTRALRDHYAELAKQVAPLLPELGTVVDIGANDGTLLTAIRRQVPSVVTAAVEPTEQADKCRAAGHVTFQRFFSRNEARLIAREIGPALLVTACNVLAHCPEPDDFLRGVNELLTDDGVFVTENHDLLSVLDGMQFDTIYHEHLRYYTIATLSRLLARHDLVVYKTEQLDVHGGSFRAWARRRKPGFADRARDVSERLRTLLAEAVTWGGGAKVAAVGATTRAAPLVNFTGIAEHLGYVCEVAGSEKIGLCLPGTEIPVVDEQRLIDEQPPFALLLSWHIASSVVPKLRERGYTGKFIVPLPEPRVIDG